MGSREIRETAITIDHDRKICLVDTTEPGLARKLRKLGFEELVSPRSGRYFRFHAEARQIRYGKKEKRVCHLPRKAPQTPSGSHQESQETS